MKLGQHGAIVRERFGACQLEQLSNHLVKVQKLQSARFLNPHSLNRADDVRRSPAVCDDIPKEFAQVIAAEFILFQETQASASVGHNYEERLVQLVRPRPPPLSHPPPPPHALHLFPLTP